MSETLIATPDESIFARVQGLPVVEMPQDLYIPPDALEVILESFEGPLDLLLYLIRKQNLNILDIPVAEISRQYLSYINMMQVLRLELAAEYLVMAATLTEIKSRLLLPKPEMLDEEHDPRAELMRKLQEYEQIKIAAMQISELPQQYRDVFPSHTHAPALEIQLPPPQVDLDDLINAYRDVLYRATLFTKHAIHAEPLSVRERMVEILTRLNAEQNTEFSFLLRKTEGKMGVVVTFLAILELLKQAMLEAAQEFPFGPLQVRTKVNEL